MCTYLFQRLTAENQRLMAENGELKSLLERTTSTVKKRSKVSKSVMKM